MQRVILHCDMNNFYASVECMLNPELKNKPVAVCGSVEERHGIVLAKNYAAKAFGDVEMIDAGIRGEIGFITPIMTEGEYAEKAKNLDIISMIRMDA